MGHKLSQMLVTHNVSKLEMQAYTCLYVISRSQAHMDLILFTFWFMNMYSQMGRYSISLLFVTELYLTSFPDRGDWSWNFPASCVTDGIVDSSTIVLVSVGLSWGTRQETQYLSVCKKYGDQSRLKRYTELL